MKNFINLFIFSILAFWGTEMMAQAQKTVIQSIPLNGANTIALAVSGNVQVSEWSNDYARLTATINIDNTSETMLKRLVEVGRYEITTQETAEGLTVSMPKVLKAVTIQGTALNENITFEVHVPKNINVQVVEPATGDGSM